MSFAFTKKKTEFMVLFALPLLISLSLFSNFFSTESTLTKNSDPKGVIQFYDEIHDFGSFEEGKKVTFRFEFQNIGDADVTITNVKASCGCTTPSYSKKAVKPNEFGFIDVVYNSENRPGPFNKKIYVDNNGNPGMIVLTIKGNATPAPITGRDLTKQGGLMISEGVLDVGNWKLGEVFRHELKIQNVADYPIKLQSYKAEIDIILSYPPYSILPGEKVKVALLFKADLKRKTGKFSEIIRIESNDKDIPEKTIELRGNLIGTQKSSLLSPKIEFNQTYIDLGDVIQNDKIQVAFAFKNLGEGDLELKSVEPSCGCTVVDQLKNIYGSNEVDTLKAVLDTEDKFGIIRKEITVTTNDPNQETVLLVLEANVKEHPNASKMAEMRANAGANASIFEGECRSCHVNRGVGKFGKDLYAASCQMCHGPAGVEDGKHHPGTPMSKDYLAFIEETTLGKLIAEGSTDPRKKGMMPGFQSDFGGPLSEQQINSLTVYLKSIPQKLN